MGIWAIFGEYLCGTAKRKLLWGFFPENWAWTSWMEAVGRGGMFILWCKLQGELELKMFSFNSFRQLLFRDKKKEFLFSHLPFLELCSLNLPILCGHGKTWKQWYQEKFPTSCRDFCPSHWEWQTGWQRQQIHLFLCGEISHPKSYSEK